MAGAAAAFLVLHGLVHGIMFGLACIPQVRPDLPFDPGHSWLIGDSRFLAFMSGLVVTVALIVTAAAISSSADWWPVATVVASALSLMLLAVYASK